MTWRITSNGYAVCPVALPPAVLEGVKHERLTARGAPVVAVPHTFDAVNTLRSRGLRVPHVHETYDWPGPDKPMNHQRRTVDFLLENRRCFVLNGLGTGKTRAAIWAADLLMRHKQVRRVLVVAPKSILHAVWAKELLFTLPRRGQAVLEGARDRKHKIARDPRIEWLIVNPESLPLLVDKLPGVDLVIVDEATKFKTGGAQRTRALAQIAAGCRLWLMTGTPAPQAPTDAHSLIRLQRQGKYISFGAFRDMAMIRVSQFTWKARPNAAEIVAREMQPAVRFKREDCFDLPERQIIDRDVEMTAEQARLVKRFKEEAWADLQGKAITAPNAAAAMGKMLQVLAGGVYGADAEGVKPAFAVDSAPLFETLTDIIEEADGPVLVFAPFRISAAITQVHLTKAGLRSAVVTAGTTSRQRKEIFEQVQARELDAMVAIPQTVSHGLTLTASNTIVWLSPPMSYETYEQANARIHRLGQTRKCVVYRLVQNRLTSELYKRLDTRATLQATILQLMETER
jgi:SNF2 family DNA or RNA helicase